MLARALHYVHQRGILHGDIKPANIMVTPSGNPKIMDFGVARRSLTQKPTWSLTGEQSVYGTPGYIAPEQFVGTTIDARADVFALGVIAYEWLAGRKPFRGDSVEETLQATLHDHPKSLCQIGNFDSELSRDVDQALARDPAQRFESADALADALEVCLERRLSPASDNGPPDSAEDQQFEKIPGLNNRNLLFADFSEDDLAKVVQMSRREDYQPDEPIFREGAGGSTMYLLVKGRVSIRKLAGTQEVEIKQIAAGECFGEMAVISQMPRSASVIALRPTQVIAISGALLRSTSPVLCMKLYRNIASLLAERLRQKDEQMIGLLQNDQTKQKARRLFPFW
jgi:serine/threonine-protein kinase